jgi:HSP20 family protein
LSQLEFHKIKKQKTMTHLVRSKSGFPSLVSDLWDSEGGFTGNLVDFEVEHSRTGNRTHFPSVNIVENEKDFQLDLAAPGLEREDFRVATENGYLTVSAEKEKESKREKQNHRRHEFSYHSFSRSFSIPENVNTEQIDARYQNGILHVSLPKKKMTSGTPKKEIKIS